MDERLLTLYNQELQHLRETAGEFAREFPKVAGRLALDRDAKQICPDPYVERMLEGFAWLAARVHLKLDAEFPRFTQALLETVYPHYLCPVPSMAIVKFDPDPAQSALVDGVPIPRGTILRGNVAKGTLTACTFQTAHDVRLLPVRIAEAQYLVQEIASLNLPPDLPGKAALRLRLETTAPVPFKKIALDPFVFFLRGADILPSAIYEQLFAQKQTNGEGVLQCCMGVLLQSPSERGKTVAVLPPCCLRRIGFSEQEALLPHSPRSFEGYRLLQEYFALPQRFLFVGLNGFAASLQQANVNQLDIIFVLREPDKRLENRVNASCFELFCTPAINLFSRTLDPISLSDRFSEFHVVADETRPLDFEVFQIESVTGHGAQSGEEQEFRPFYVARDVERGATYYTINRVPRVLTAKEKQFGKRSNYAGTEVYISIVDSSAAPYRPNLKHLGLRALCTNRHLPIQLAVGVGRTDFTLETNAPVTAIRCLEGPTLPRPSQAEGRFTWRLVSHLALNYLSLVDVKGGDSAGGLREILRLYSPPGNAEALREIEGIRQVHARPVLRRVKVPGPITFARGLELTVTFDEKAFEGQGAFILGAVLEQFFARYVSLNSFTETVIVSQQNGEITRWPAQLGKRQIL